MLRRKSRGDGFHITKVGLWFLVFLLIIVAAATNTGNNGLFLVLAVMGAAVVVSEIVARINARGLEVSLSAPAEVFAKQPSHLDVTVTNRGRWLPRWLLVTTVEPGIYIGNSRKVPARFRNIGIRIEDDVAVTSKGPDVLTKGLAKDPDDIEKLMASR